ncbi:uncharacterized protein LOC114156064 isoform X2 [Xiphophorus couchianus]|uniref:uncharacterized protein LOC114156064 isoform X2 n=1 Tax=Xiphophorus couchianus TaxID=32473 RepID=UPI001016317C|nr:uncharacterized protein LOC114156064 isoform X2 [Xiphophorus couchianus]
MAESYTNRSDSGGGEECLLEGRYLVTLALINVFTFVVGQPLPVPGLPAEPGLPLPVPPPPVRLALRHPELQPGRRPHEFVLHLHGAVRGGAPPPGLPTAEDPPLAGGVCCAGLALLAVCRHDNHAGQRRHVLALRRRDKKRPVRSDGDPDPPDGVGRRQDRPGAQDLQPRPGPAASGQEEEQVAADRRRECWEFSQTAARRRNHVSFYPFLKS